MSSKTFLAALRGYVQEILAKGDLFKSILTLNSKGKTAKEIISINTKGPTSPVDIENIRQSITSYLKDLKAKAQAQASASKPPANPIDKLKDNLKFMDEYGALSYVSHMLMLALVYLDIRQDNAADLNASKKSSAFTNQALAGLDAEVKRLRFQWRIAFYEAIFFSKLPGRNPIDSSTLTVGLVMMIFLNSSDTSFMTPTCVANRVLPVPALPDATTIGGFSAANRSTYLL